eukprot:790840-Pelagomonas_calceolata.AAC.7
MSKCPPSGMVKAWPPGSLARLPSGMVAGGPAAVRGTRDAGDSMSKCPFSIVAQAWPAARKTKDTETTPSLPRQR